MTGDGAAIMLGGDDAPPPPPTSEIEVLVSVDVDAEERVAPTAGAPALLRTFAEIVSLLVAAAMHAVAAAYGALLSRRTVGDGHEI